MAQLPNSTKRREKGQSLVEFALVLMFIILPLTFVFIDGALMLFTLSNVTNAAREGAHAGSIYQTFTSQGGTQAFSDYTAQIDGERKTAITQAIREWLRSVPLVDPQQCTNDTNLIITYDPDPPALGNPFRELNALKVQLTCPHRLLFGLVGASQVNLTGEATMKIEPGGVYSPTVSLP